MPIISNYKAIQKLKEMMFAVSVGVRLKDILLSIALRILYYFSLIRIKKYP